MAIQQRQDIKNAYIHSINDVDVKTNAWKKLLNAPGTAACKRMIYFNIVNSNRLLMLYSFSCCGFVLCYVIRVVASYVSTRILLLIHTVYTYTYMRKYIHFINFLSGKDTQAASKEQAMKAAIEAMEIAKNEYEKVCG